MQLTDLRKTLSEMTDEELQEHYRSLRRRRDVVKPKEVKTGGKKESLTSMVKRLQKSAGMSKEEIKELISQIEQRMEDEKQASARQAG